jgi:MFS family permease
MMRRSTIAAIGLTALALAIGLYAAIADAFLPVRAGVPGPGASPAQVAVVAVFIFGTPVIGGFIAARRPSNPTGWLFLLMVLGLAVSFASDDFVRHAEPDALAGWIGTIGSSLGGLAFLGLFLLLMLFPTGTLPSHRWRWLPIVAVVGIAASAINSLFSPGSPVTPVVPGLINPLGEPGWQPVLTVLNAVGELCFFVMVIGSVALLVVRFRRSRGTERQQLKWFVSAATVTALLLIGALAFDVVAPSATLGDVLWGNVLWILAISSLALLPAAAAIAILRHQLFDIDVLIKRTLVYGSLTAVLAVTYAATVLVLGSLFTNVTGSGNLAVAASTLAVLALFQPIRRRIQEAVDRRFHRGRYDAQHTVEQFAGRLRDEVDPGRVAVELSAAVKATIQPTALSIWIRER